MKRFSRQKKTQQALSLAEMLVSMVASALILGALLTSAMSLRRGFNSLETYTDAYAAQRRITDYLGRDLRRAIGLAMTNENGDRQEVGEESVDLLIAERASLIIKLPAYYRSNDPSSEGYDSTLAVVATDERLDYGTEAGLAEPVEVTYRKIFFAQENCVCFVRQEGDAAQAIVVKADDLYVRVHAGTNAQISQVQTWFRSQSLGPKPLVTTFDGILLRNPPINFKP